MLKLKGIHLALMAAIVSGLANFVNKFVMQEIGKGPFQFTLLKNALVAFILVVIVLCPKILPKLKKVKKPDWQKLILIGLIGGAIPFLLFFKGLSLTSPLNAAFIHKTLFIWAAILAVPLLKEKINKIQFLALAILLGGIMLSNGLPSFRFGYAEFLIWLAVLGWSIEYIIAKKALKNTPAQIVAWARMFFGSIFIFLYLALTNNLTGISHVNPSQFIMLTLFSFLLLVYVLLWYKALQKEKVTVITSVLVVAFPITSLLNAALIEHSLAVEKIFASLIITSAVLAFYKFRSKEKTYACKTAQA